MTSDSRADDVAAYAAAVRSALGDLPPDENVALLEDLEDHLAEISGEGEGTLAERLGPPEKYAAELRAAYGAAHPRGRQRRPQLRSILMGVVASTAKADWYRDVRGFLPTLRPAWWVFRAYVVVMILTAVLSSGHNLRPIPNPFSSRGLLQVIATIVAIVLSVRIGQRGRPRVQNFRIVSVLANTAIALATIPMLGSMSTDPGYSYPIDPATQTGAPAYAGGPTTNIYAYSRDGRQLNDVLLYDQNGAPLTVGGQASDVTTTYPLGADGLPIENAYPLNQRHPDGSTVAVPRVAIPPWPTPTVTASPSPSPSPSRTP